MKTTGPHVPVNQGVRNVALMMAKLVPSACRSHDTPLYLQNRWSLSPVGFAFGGPTTAPRRIGIVTARWSGVESAPGDRTAAVGTTSRSCLTVTPRATIHAQNLDDGETSAVTALRSVSLCGCSALRAAVEAAEGTFHVHFFVEIFVCVFEAPAGLKSSLLGVSSPGNVTTADSTGG